MRNAEIIEEIEEILVEIEEVRLNVRERERYEELLERLYVLDYIDWLVRQAKTVDMARRLSVYHQQKRKEAEDKNEPYRHENRKLKAEIKRLRELLNKAYEYGTSSDAYRDEKVVEELYEYLYGGDDE